MITVGADVHKRTHTFVAVNDKGVKIGQKTVAAITAGHQAAIKWAVDLAGDEPLTWAIEDCRNMSGRLERDLLAARHTSVRVAPHLMAAARRTGRERGKSDPIDALAVARAAQREPNLPTATHDPISRDLKLLTDHRDRLVTQRTALINQARWYLHELDPEFDDPSASLTAAIHQKRTAAWLKRQSGILAEVTAEYVADIAALTVRINTVAKKITVIVDPVSVELQQIVGCGPLVAARLLGEVANITRFPNAESLARYGGLAPVPVWSGSTNGRVRMTRSGNRQINRAFHTISLTQTRDNTHPGHTYLHKKTSEGKTNTEARRSHKRVLARPVYNAMLNDYNNRTNTASAVAA